MGDTIKLRLEVELTYVDSTWKPEELAKMVKEDIEDDLKCERTAVRDGAEINKFKVSMARDMTGEIEKQVEEIALKLREGGFTEGHYLLDDWVHDHAAAHASSVNNQGLDDQVRFVIETSGYETAVADVPSRIENLKADKAES